MPGGVKLWHDQQPSDQHSTCKEWAGEKTRALLPLGRWQTPEDIANRVIFLTTDRAAQSPARP